MAKKIKAAEPLPPSTPVGNFPPSDVDTEDESGQTAEEHLDESALSYLSDPQAFIDAFITEANKVESDASKIHIAAAVMKEVLGVVSTVVPGAAIGVKIVDAIDNGVTNASK